MTELREYTGAVHIHTAYSDGAGRMPYVVRCAKKAGLDYLIVSDHNSLRAKHEGWDGWHEGVLLIIGVEISSRKGHALALGLDDCARHEHRHPDAYLPGIARAGAIAFLAHPERTHRGTILHRPPAWPTLKTDCYVGVEIWSYMHDLFDWAFPWHLIGACRRPDAGIRGPYHEVLDHWDRVAQRRHVSGIGSLDAHEVRFPTPRCRWAMLRLFPLELLLQTIRTHVLAPPMTGDADADIAALTEALAAGRCFTAYRPLGEAAGTRFEARRRDEVLTMGDEAPAGAELEFAFTVPKAGELSLLRNSEGVAAASSRELVHRDARPGVYRAEARIGGRPWIFTNHIYVR